MNVNDSTPNECKYVPFKCTPRENKYSPNF